MQDNHITVFPISQLLNNPKNWKISIQSPRFPAVQHLSPNKKYA